MQFSNPFEPLFQLQRMLDSHRASPWLDSGPSSEGPYPPLNIFRKGHDFVLIAELPGVKKSDLDIQIKDNLIRIAGSKSPDNAEGSYHRRERLAGQFDRTINVPVRVDADAVKAEYRDGILALLLPRAESDKPKSIKVS